METFRVVYFILFYYDYFNLHPITIIKKDRNILEIFKRLYFFQIIFIFWLSSLCNSEQKSPLDDAKQPSVENRSGGQSFLSDFSFFGIKNFIKRLKNTISIFL